MVEPRDRVLRRARDAEHVLHQPEYVLPAVGTCSETHLDEALAAADLRLSVDHLAWLEQGVRQPV